MDGRTTGTLPDQQTAGAGSATLGSRISSVALQTKNMVKDLVTGLNEFNKLMGDVLTHFGVEGYMAASRLLSTIASYGMTAMSNVGANIAGNLAAGMNTFRSVAFGVSTWAVKNPDATIDILAAVTGDPHPSTSAAGALASGLMVGGEIVWDSAVAWYDFFEYHLHQ